MRALEHLFASSPAGIGIIRWRTRCSSSDVSREHRAGLARALGPHLVFARCATGRVASHVDVVSDRSGVLPFRGRRSKCLLDPG
jgi:hypothetical protein